MFRSSPPEVFSKKDAAQIRAEARSQQSRFATLLKSHAHTDAPRESKVHPQNTSPRENTSGRQLVYVKRVLKNINYKKLLFTVAKRN